MIWIELINTDFILDCWVNYYPVLKKSAKIRQIRVIRVPYLPAALISEIRSIHSSVIFFSYYCTQSINLEATFLYKYRKPG
jgi:hypothetical protein